MDPGPRDHLAVQNSEIDGQASSRLEGVSFWCPVCNIRGFQSLEQVDIHLAMVHRKSAASEQGGQSWDVGPAASVLPAPSRKRKRVSATLPSDKTTRDEKKVTAYACPMCEAVKPSGRALREHLSKVHNVASSKVRSLRKVMEKKVRVKVEEKPSDETSGRKVWNECHGRRGWSRKPAKNVDELLNKLYYNCRICFQAYEETEQLEFHIKKDHPDELRLQSSQRQSSWNSDCCQCLKPFSSKNNLTRHYLAVHLGYKPFSCQLCSHRFSGKQETLKHLAQLHQHEMESKSESRAPFYAYQPKPENFALMGTPIPKTLYFIA